MYKYCIVPTCSNTSIKTPGKHFFFVPKGSEMRNKWCLAVKRNKPLSAKSTRMCCEDHFDVEEDTLNYIKYKIMLQENRKVALRLKPGVVPRKFLCEMKVPEKFPPEQKKLSKRRRLATKNAKHKEPTSEQPMEGKTLADADAAPPAAEATPLTSEIEIKTEMLDEWPEPQDPLGTSSESWEEQQDSGTDHKETSLLSSPPDIKEETEFEEDSFEDQKVNDYESIISKLQEEMAELKSENQRLADENRRLANENRILTEKSHNITSGIEQLLQKSEHQMTNYDKNLSKVKVVTLEENKKLKEENERLSKTVYSLNSESKKQATSILHLTEKNQKLIARTEQLKSKVQQLTALKKKATLTELKQKIEELEISNRDLTEEVYSVNLVNKSIVEQMETYSEGTTRNELIKIRCLTAQNRVLVERVRKLKEAKDGKNKRKRKLV